MDGAVEGRGGGGRAPGVPVRRASVAELAPSAPAAAGRAGLDLADATPRTLTDDDLGADIVVTVCDRAREELAPGEGWLHWSVPDPVDAGTPRAFDTTVAELDARITVLSHTDDPHP